MKTLSAWLSPFDPRGMSLWGSVACFILAYGLYGVQGRLVEVWPNRCSLIKSQLLQATQIDLPSDQKNSISHPLLLQSVKVSEQKLDQYWLIANHDQKEDSWLIPKADYYEAQVKLNRMKPIWVEIKSIDGQHLSLTYEPEQSPVELYKYLMQSKGLKEAHSMIEEQAFSRSSLEKLGYEKTPYDLSCQREHMDKELHLLVALLLKSTVVGLESVEQINHQLWLSKRQVADRQHYKVQSLDQAKSADGSWSISWVKNKHVSQTKSIVDRPFNLNTETPPAWLITLLQTLSSVDKPATHLATQLATLAPEIKLIK